MANFKTLNEDYGTIMMISGDEKNRQAISRTVKRVYKRKKINQEYLKEMKLNGLLF